MVPGDVRPRDRHDPRGPGRPRLRDDRLCVVVLHAVPPLLGKNNLLLVNLRGTGNSSAFTCKALQNWVLADGIRAYTADTGKCGFQLNHTRKLKDSGKYVRGSNLYTTAIAAHDVAVLLQRLQTGKVNLYGDSYGTFFSQVFTSHYASLLASVTLDAAYPVSQTDPWYPHMILTARKAFNLACQRSVACARAAPGSSWARIAKLAAYLGQHRLRGKTLDPYGDVVTQTVGEDALIELVNIAGEDDGVYRELDPAIRAELGHHDDGRCCGWPRWRSTPATPARPLTSMTAPTRPLPAWITRSRSAMRSARRGASGSTTRRWPGCARPCSPRSASTTGSRSRWRNSTPASTGRPSPKSLRPVNETARPYAPRPSPSWSCPVIWTR